MRNDDRARLAFRLTVLCSRFRWVQCQIDTLDRCASVSEIRNVLESLPEGLEETYRRILFSIDRRPEARVVRRALVWLVTALRPMRLRELLEGITIDFARQALDPGFTPMKDVDILENSRSLVFHHIETDVVTLSHMSVKVGKVNLFPPHGRLKLEFIGIPYWRTCRGKITAISYRPGGCT